MASLLTSRRLGLTALVRSVNLGTKHVFLKSIAPSSRLSSVRPLTVMSRESNSVTRLWNSPLMQQWRLSLARVLTDVPPGFEKFLPEDQRPSKSDKQRDHEKETEQRSGKTSNTEEAKANASKVETEGEGEGEGEGERSSRKRKKRAPPEFAHVFGFLGVTGMALAGYLLYDGKKLDGVPDMTFQEFRTQLLEQGKVDHLHLFSPNVVHVYLRGSAHPNQPDRKFSIGSLERFERNLEEAQRDLGIDPHDFIPVAYAPWIGNSGGGGGRSHNEMLFDGVWGLGLTVAMLVGVTYMLRKGMGGDTRGGKNIFSIGKANPTVVGKDMKVKTTFKDVAGLGEAKAEIMEFVQFLKNPQKYKALGAKLPKGALLVGPPGTGKTLLARATAGEAGVPFFSMSGSDFLEMFVGVGPSRVRDLFATARENSPCIVFIDEIDAVGRSRSKGGFSGGHDERENTLNQLLVEMDGFTTHTGVVVLAGTNRADILDAALLRPGRFDRQIAIDKPDLQSRQEIFKVHLRPLKLDPNYGIDDYANRLASLTPGFAGADIANVCNEAAIVAARREHVSVEFADFESATERVIGGLEKRNKVMSKQDRTLVAFHEAGHAIAGWFMRWADPLLKVSIVPRGGGALGYAQYLPDELMLMNKEQIYDRMCMALGGRAAELVFFGKVSTGAADDLNKVTKMAHSVVSVFGMSDRIGNLSYQEENNGFVQSKPYSEATAQMIDEEVRSLVSQAFERTVQLITSKKDAVERLANLLLEKETISHHDVVALVGDRPYPVSEALTQYLKSPTKLEHNGTDNSTATGASTDADASTSESTSQKSSASADPEEAPKKKNTEAKTSSSSS
eukprot:GILJ01001658.1.p1 GENE.GILJ01001658.1~~GILJ01001658.1.p1  ORF type:complete len:844 (-),score=125.04 GILJ01001658.1:132-2663(-)